MKVEIPERYRTKLMMRWGLTQVNVDPDDEERTECPLCLDASRKMQGAPPDAELCAYCPVKWPDDIPWGESGMMDDCLRFLRLCIDDPALSRRILYPLASQVTPAEYSAARQRVLAHIEWIAEPEGEQV